MFIKTKKNLAFFMNKITIMNETLLKENLDKLCYKFADETNKKKGYDIKKGLKSLYINYDEDNLKKKLVNG